MTYDFVTYLPVLCNLISISTFSVSSRAALSREGVQNRAAIGLTDAMVAVSKTQLDSYPENGTVRIMADAAHEVSATLLLTIDGRKVYIGNMREVFDDLANVMVRLGTKVSDGYPSSIGFRVLLRTDTPKSRDSGSIKDNYHLMSCKFNPQWGEISYKLATKVDKRELVEVRLFRVKVLLVVSVIGRRPPSLKLLVNNDAKSSPTGTNFPQVA